MTITLHPISNLRLFPHDPNQQLPKPHFSRTERVYLWTISYTLMCISLITSAIVLYRVKKRKPRSLFAKEAFMEGPGALQRLFDSLVSSSSSSSSSLC